MPNAPFTSSDGINQIATFNASANLIIGDSGGATEFDYLVIAGGGSGGNGGNAGGGGGAGGYRTSFPGGQKILLNPGPNAITIGAGGATSGPSNGQGNNGTDSIVSYIHPDGS